MYSVMNIKCCWSFLHVLENIIQQYAFLKLTWQFDNSLTAGVCVWLCPCVPAHSICVFSITGTTEIQSLNRFSARVLSLSISPCSTHHPKMQLSHVEYPRTCFSTFWQINHMSTSAQCTECLFEKTNTSACHTVTMVCKYEFVCCLPLVVSVSVFSSILVGFPLCWHRCAALRGGTCVLGLLLMQTESGFLLFHFASCCRFTVVTVNLCWHIQL